MPPVIDIAMPELCFCGQEASQGSIYCSPFCAREDAFNSLTLGKPHECSNPVAPLPTLPPGFFDLPPKRGNVSLSLHDPDEFDFGFDQGPFQQTKAKSKAVKSKPKPSKSSTKVTTPSPRSSAYVTEQIGGNSKPVPRPSKQPRTRRPAAPADADNTAPRKRSKWRSHYQKAQEDTAASLEVPWLFVDSPAGEEDTEELGKAQDKELINAPAKTGGDLELLMPTPLSPQQPLQRENGLPRTGSFGPMPIATNSTLISAISKKDTTAITAADGTGVAVGGGEAAFKGHARREYSRSSSSSGISGLTSGTSRTSYTSLAGTSDVSMTKSELPPPSSPPLPRSSTTIITCNSELRPGYGSAFGSVEDNKPQLSSQSQSITTTSIAPIVQQLAADLQATILQARRESQNRRRSRTLALPTSGVEKSSTTAMNFVKRSSRQSFHKQKAPPAAVDDLMDVIDISAPVKKTTTTTEPVKRKMGGTPVSRSQWTQMRTPTSPCGERAPSTIIPAVPSMPSSRLPLPPMSSSASATNTTTSTEMSAPTPHSVAGTVVKKTTVVNNSRLPIGSGLLSFKTPPMPSSSLSPTSNFTNSSARLPSNTPSSAFHVSLQSKSYRAPAYAMSVPKIPASTRALHTSPSNRSLKSKKSEGHIRIPSVNDEERTSLFERLKSSLDLPLAQQQQQQQQKVSMEEEYASDATNARSLRPTLKLDPLEASHSSDNLTLAMTPRVTSPWSDRTSSTSGGPNTPRPSADTASSQPFWMASSSPAVAGSMAFLEQDPMLMSGRTVRLGSDASTTTSEMTYSSSTPDGLMRPAAPCVPQRTTIRRSRSEAALNIFKFSSR